MCAWAKPYSRPSLITHSYKINFFLEIGDSCNTNAECYIPDTLTFCVQSVCVCNKFYHAIENGQRCIKSKILGETCESDTECTVENSKCHGECRCNIHYVSSHDKTICLEGEYPKQDFQFSQASPLLLYFE